MFVDETSDHILDIKEYQKLNKRDAIWLCNILKKKKYEAIAIDSKITLGAVKNRFKLIFNELCVGDKQGFLNTYSDYKIYFGDELITAENIVDSIVE